MAEKTAKTTLRLAREDLEELDRRARDRGMSRTRFLVERGLESPEELVGRVDVLERRMGAVRAHLALLGMEVA